MANDELNKLVDDGGREEAGKDSDTLLASMPATDSDAEPIDWEPIYMAYKGQWVALEDNETTVIANADTATEARDKARDKGFENPILTPVRHKAS